MTREEAIKILTEYFDGGCTDFVWDAYQLAIKALRAQDVDAVSRQAVMWMLTNLSYTQCRTQGEVEVIGLAKTMLIAMPSAQEVNNANQELNNSTATQPNGIESQASYRQVTGKLDVTDCISRQAAIERMTEAIMSVPSAQPEPLTDKEQRIFLAAMGREEKVCKQVDEECRDCREPYEDSLVSVCREITRKVKGALWTI